MLLGHLHRREGLRGLWKGTPEALLMAVPLVGVYLPVYDALLHRLAQAGPEASLWAPLVAGAVSRTLSVVCVGPLELLRTQSQAFSRTHSAANHRRGVRAPPLWTVRRLSTMWTGVSATLARDVPYSALYWAGVEWVRARMLDRLGDEALTTGQVLSISTVAGASSGMVAAAVTTPLDVIKSRMQLAPLLSARPTAAAVSAAPGLAFAGDGTGAVACGHGQSGPGAQR